MSKEDTRKEMYALRQFAEEESRAQKDTYITVDKLTFFYKNLVAPHREDADEVLSEWVLSENSGIRFDAIILIKEFKILAALQSLETLSTRLEESTLPSAPYEIKKVQRVIASLKSDTTSQTR